MFASHRDLFHIKLGDDPPARFAQMQIQVKENFSPVREKQRRYPPKKLAFMKMSLNGLVNIGTLKFSQESRFASRVVAIPKHGMDRLRFTVDLGAPNKETLTLVFSIPDMEKWFSIQLGVVGFL